MVSGLPTSEFAGRTNRRTDNGYKRVRYIYIAYCSAPFKKNGFDGLLKAKEPCCLVTRPSWFGAQWPCPSPLWLQSPGGKGAHILRPSTEGWKASTVESGARWWIHSVWLSLVLGLAWEQASLREWHCSCRWLGRLLGTVTLETWWSYHWRRRWQRSIKL